MPDQGSIHHYRYVVVAIRARQRARRREREATDPVLRERRLAAKRTSARTPTRRARSNAWQRARYHADSAFRQRVQANQRRWLDRRRAAGQKPSDRRRDYQNAWRRERYRTDPAFRARAHAAQQRWRKRRREEARMQRAELEEHTRGA